MPAQGVKDLRKQKESQETRVASVAEEPDKAEAKGELDLFTESDGDRIVFSVWDNGGQRIFQTVQHLLMSRLGVFIVVFNLVDLVPDARPSSSKPRHSRT